jgi:mutator protein MutT
MKKAPEHNAVIPCGVAIIRRGSEFLVSQRCAEDTFGSFWEFPGGRKNPGETFEDCVVRETKEELGIEIAVRSKFMEIRKKYNEKIIWLNFYLCDYVSGDPQAIECQKFEWSDVAGLKKFRFPPANEVVIAKLAEIQQ